MAGSGGGLTVEGWSRSTSARLDDLDRLARLVGEAGLQLGLQGQHLATLGGAVDLVSSAPLSPGTAAAAEAAILSATLGRHGAIPTARRLEATALLVAAAATAYRAAESAVDGIVSGVQVGAGMVVGATVMVTAEGAAVAGTAVAVAVAPEAATLAAVVLPFALPAALRGPAGAVSDDLSGVLGAVQAMLTAHPELVQQLSASGGGLVAGAELALPPGVSQAAMAGLGVPLSTQQAALLLARSYVDGVPVVTRVAPETALPDPEALPYPPPSTISGLYAGLGHDSADHGLPGRITVTTMGVHRADGRVDVSYVVNLPGMDSFGLPGHQSSDARDNSGNLRLVGGAGSVYTRGIAEAMALAGVPRGAKVALVGHSQGGIAAVELAQDKAFTSRYTVTHVLTAASPVASLPKNPDVDYLALENDHDLVPRVDGAPSVARPHVTVARFSLDTGSVGGNHDMQAYAAAARDLDAAAATDEDIASYDASLHAAGFLVGHGESAEVGTQAFQITSERSPKYASGGDRDGSGSNGR